MNGSYILDQLGQHKYALLLPAAIIEGPIVTVLVGLLSVSGKIDAPIAYVIVVLADLVSDTFWYILGRFGYHSLSPRLKKWLGIDEKILKKFTVDVKRRFGRIIFMGKFTQVFSSIIELAVGVARIPFGTFIFYNTANTAVKSALFFFIGVFFGNAYSQISSYLNIYSIVIIFISIIGSIWFVEKTLKKKIKK